jgi:hypothetical protein
MRGRRKNSESTAGVCVGGRTFEPSVDAPGPERETRSRMRWLMPAKNESEVASVVDFFLAFDDGKAEGAERRLFVLS